MTTKNISKEEELMREIIRQQYAYLFRAILPKKEEDEIVEIVKTDSDYPDEFSVSDVEIGIKNYLDQKEIDNELDFEPNNTCEHCGGEAMFETENSEQTSGDTCDICDDWVCQDCLDYSKSDVDYDNVCKKCAEEMDIKSALELAKEGLDFYHNADDNNIYEIAQSADLMADAIDELLKNKYNFS